MRLILDRKLYGVMLKYLCIEKIRPMEKTKVLASLIVFSIMINAAATEPIDNLPLFGCTLDYSQRRGFLEFSGGHTEALDRNNLLTMGVMMGKRWPIGHRMRLQVAADIQYGSTVDDTLGAIPVRDAGGTVTMQPTLLKTPLFHGGCVAELQYPFKVAPDGQWFLIAGAGAHIARVREREVILGNPQIRVTGDSYVEGSEVMFSASIHGGLGFEIIVSPLFGIAASYSLRYWYPVRYGMTRDYFPYQPIDYRERFLSHEINVIVLVKR